MVFGKKLVATFTYDLEISKRFWKKQKLSFFTLSDYITFIDKALEMDYISVEELSILKKWRRLPKDYYSSESG